MRVLPVLDLMGGVIVRGVAGERERYRPITSGIVSSSRPIEVARALRGTFALDSFYLADLDAIEGKRADLALYEELVDDGFRLLVDAGLRSKDDAAGLESLVSLDVVAALETLPSPDVLASIVDCLGSGRVVFSLDLKSGQPLGCRMTWPTGIEAVAECAESTGVRRAIVLDLAAVGVGGGTPHLEFCRRWKRTCPELELITGGGVRGIDDLTELRDAGVDGVLVASALHDGRLDPGAIARVTDGSGVRDQDSSG